MECVDAIDLLKDEIINDYYKMLSKLHKGYTINCDNILTKICFIDVHSGIPNNMLYINKWLDL